MVLKGAMAVCGFIPSFRKGAKGFCSFLWRKKKEPKKHPPITSSSLYGRDVIDFRQRPPYIKVLVSLSSLCPFGVRDKVFIGLRGEGDEGINRRFCEEVVRYGKLVMLGVITSDL